MPWDTTSGKKTITIGEDTLVCDNSSFSIYTNGVLVGTNDTLGIRIKSLADAKKRVLDVVKDQKKANYNMASGVRYIIHQGKRMPIPVGKYPTFKNAFEALLTFDESCEILASPCGACWNKLPYIGKVDPFDSAIGMGWRYDGAGSFELSTRVHYGGTWYTFSEGNTSDEISLGTVKAGDTHRIFYRNNEQGYAEWKIDGVLIASQALPSGFEWPQVRWVSFPGWYGGGDDQRLNTAPRKMEYKLKIL